MVLLKRQKIVFQPLPERVALYQQAANGQADTNGATSSKPTPQPQDGTGELDEEKKDEPLDPKLEVYYLHETGEVFLDYESYSTRMQFYKQKTFQCEVTGHSNLTYFDAVRSEEREARLLHERFPAKLKGPLLRAVQFQLIGRMDRLIDVVHDRFANRFYDGERLFVDVDSGAKCHAQVMRTYAPTPRVPTPEPFSSPVKPGSPSTESMISLSPPPSPQEPHRLGVDLRLTQEEAERKDDPNRYRYSVQLLDSKGRMVGKNGDLEGESSNWAATWMDVKPEQLSRDRLAFSKSILKRFLRDCLDRDATSATSPWIVKPALAAKYDIPTELTDSFKKEIEGLKEAASRRRKRKVDDDPVGSGLEDEREEIGEDGQPIIAKRKRRTKAELLAAQNGGINPETGRPPTPERKKPVKYPAEDLLCSLSAREIKEGKTVQRPIPSRDLPFGDHFETLIMTWNFLQSFGKLLVLSPFTLDDFESSLTYNAADPAHPLTIEIHAALLNLISRDAIITRPLRSYGQSWTPRGAILEEGAEQAVALEDDEMDGRSEAAEEWKGPGGLTEVKVVSQAQEVARKATWMMGGELRVKDSRKGWESWLVGCIVDRADKVSFPQHLQHLADLLFSDDEDDEDEAPSWTVTDSPVHENGLRTTLPSARYHLLKPETKLEIIAFLCDLAMQTKAARDAMEESTAQLTEVRKEMQDVKREALKAQQLAEEAEAAASVEQSDAKVKTATARQLTQERRRLEEEHARLSKREEALHRDFRKQINFPRAKPLGFDRFGNSIWWFDGTGSAPLIGPGGVILYGTGRLFIQGADPLKRQWLGRKVEVYEEEINKRRRNEEGEAGMLKEGEWAVYEDPAQISAFLQWLNIKGYRETKLNDVLQRWWDYIHKGAEKRWNDLQTKQHVQSAAAEQRRSTRTGQVSDLSNSSLQWRNRKADPGPR